jgi:hypothetical protein
VDLDLVGFTASHDCLLIEERGLEV